MSDKKRIYDPNEFEVTLEKYGESDDDGIVTLVSKDGEEVDFVRVATAENNFEKYAILQPVELLEGMKEDEALVFEMTGNSDEDDEDYDNNTKYEIVLDDEIIDSVFVAYEACLVESDNNHKKCEDMCLSVMSKAYPKLSKKRIVSVAKEISEIILDKEKPLKEIQLSISNLAIETNQNAANIDEVFNEILRKIDDNEENAYRLYDLFFNTLNEVVYVKLIFKNRYNLTKKMYEKLIEYGKKHFDHLIL